MFFLWLVKSSKNLVNNRLADHLKKWGLFSDFQFGFWSSCSNANLLIVVYVRIARAFNRFGATWALALDISKAFNRLWHTGLLHKLNMLHSIFIVKTIFVSSSNENGFVNILRERESILIIVCFTKESKHCNKKVYICIFFTLWKCFISINHILNKIYE